MTTKNTPLHFIFIFEKINNGFQLFLRGLKYFFFFCFCALCLGTFLFCLAMIVGIWGLVTDGVDVENYTESVTVISTEYVENYSTTQFVRVGKTNIINQTQIDDSWSAVVTDGTNTITCPITQETFNTIEKDSVVDAQLYVGKHSNKVNCRSL